MLGDSGPGSGGGAAAGSAAGIHPHCILDSISRSLSHVLHLLPSLLQEPRGLFLGLPRRLGCLVYQFVLLHLQPIKKIKRNHVEEINPAALRMNT